MNPHSSDAPGPEPASGRFLFALLTLFIGSGCAALIYEIVWFQLLQLVIGLTNVSLGVLLGTYMGGMCLGSLLLPRLISPRLHPLRVYAFLEAGLAVAGIGILYVVPEISSFYVGTIGHGLPGILMRGVVAALCLLPPTILMGATLPAAARWIETSRTGVSWLGFFYGGNIAGAFFGCLLAGFYLLRVHDMATATFVAAAINIAVALTGLALAWKSGRGWNTVPARSIDDAEGTPAAELSDSLAEPATRSDSEPASGAWQIYATIALSGMAALGAEVVWTRLLSLLLGGTVYTFSIILAAFLAGLGIGSSAGALLGRSVASARRALCGCQMLLVGAVAWAAYNITSSLPYWPVNPSLSPSPWFNFQLDLMRCLWMVLPSAVLWGASFPLALASLDLRGHDPGRLVGGLYAANTVGAIAGALSFSLLVIPTGGTQFAQRLLIVISGLAAVIILAPLLTAKSRQAGSSKTAPLQRNGFRAWLDVDLGIGAWLGITGLLVWSLPAIPWGLAAYGRFMLTYGNRLAPEIIAEQDIPTESGNPDIFCTYVGEGLNGTVAVTKWKSGARNFHSAGKVQASSDPHDMRLQRMLGHISALAHEKPESVLVVACGAGVTAGSFVTHPDVKKIVICDIEPLVPKMVAPMFKKENYDVVNDPRTQVVLDDGRHFIRTSQEKFDIITSDPIDPWVKGCAALNTIEYYEMCKAHLKPGGVMSLWIPLYESNPETVKSLIATFFKVFPNGILWSNDDEGEGYDAVLFGQTDGTEIDLDKLQARLDRPDHSRVKQSLDEVGFHSGLDLLATYAGQASDLQEWMRDAQINTDRNLRLQYLAGLSFNSFMSGEILNEITQHQKFPEKLFVGSDRRKLLLKGRIRRMRS